MKRPEARRKLSEARKGENNPMYGRTGENHPNYGKPRSEETKRKMSENHQTKQPEHLQKRRRSEYNPAREFFFSLSPDMELKEKRRLMFQKFAGVPGRNTLSLGTQMDKRRLDTTISGIDMRHSYPAPHNFKGRALQCT